VAFLDEEEEDLPLPDAPERPARPPRPPRSPRQQILVRRLIAVGFGVLFLILVVIAFRGCLNARKERAIKQFMSDTSSLVTESNNLGSDFFGLLNDPGGRTALEYGTQVKSYRGGAETQYSRAKSIGTPGEMSQAKQALVVAMQLRRNALGVIADNIDTALGKEGAIDAQKTISDQMKLLYASDQVVSGVLAPAAAAALSDAGISNGSFEPLPTTTFVPEPAEQWLDETKITDALSQVSGVSTATTPGTHGMALISTKIGDTQLVPGTPVTVPSANPTLNIDVQNSGDSEESDVVVDVTVGSTNLSQTIPRIGAGETQTVKIPITPLPNSGEQSSINVTIESVPGEQVESNNSSTYTVTFQ
jgi:hypothetical protein